jgi:hypothetical protein
MSGDTMLANTCDVRVGRLMEIKNEAGFRSFADVEAQRAAISHAFSKVATGSMVVICADWRRCPLMAAEASDSFAKMIGSFNPRIERSAILSAADSPLTVLQFLRITRESQHPKRRVVQELSELEEWLTPCLTPPEVTRLRQFLAGG